MSVHIRQVSYNRIPYYLIAVNELLKASVRFFNHITRSGLLFYNFIQVRQGQIFSDGGDLRLVLLLKH